MTSQEPPSRTAAMHAGLVGASIFLILLLIFILQNLHSVSVHFFTARVHLPVGVVLILAVVIGAVLVSAASLMRVAQIRVRARRELRQRDGRGRRRRS